jgi:predicted ATPase
VDAHWSDPTSLELLDLIIDRVPGLPLLLIVTFRPEFSPPWAGRPHVSWLGLNRLPPRQRAEMIAGVTGGKALPQEIAAQIIDRTDGVPLFVEELTKAVVESGMLTDAGDRYTVAGAVTLLTVPASLQASLLARLDRLAPVREVAQIGAALGRQFSHELIGAVALMPRAQLDDALAQLVRAELIYRRGTPPNAEYTFKHALVQDAAYSTLLRTTKLPPPSFKPQPTCFRQSPPTAYPLPFPRGDQHPAGRVMGILRPTEQIVLVGAGADRT